MDAIKKVTDYLGVQFESNSSFILVSSVLLAGIFTIVAPIFSFIRVLFSLFVLPGKPISSFGPRGSWALITGASDGIGKEFALALAKKGYNIILISRTQSKLDTLASEISSKYGPKISTKTLAMDFSQNKDSDYTALRKLADGLDVSILVNNVGLSHSIPVPFVETPAQEMNDIIMINCMATLRVTKLIAPGMISRKRGLILTMASFGGFFPTPLLATYSGSKAFLQQWSTALGSELQPHGVHVQCIQSHLVTTAMSKIRKTSALVPNPRQFVQAVLGKIGRSGGAQNVAFTSTPYWSHGLMQWFLSRFLGERSQIVVKINRGMHEDIRKRALRKAARDAKNQ
ncbi:NAD(P)-binding protein [Trematosphaeria pertusa]|uniref:Very-long-chain 3-oxoacyl-CoA reductase n=1 Tax=Trematosphaeria pertusa TaxID=390896 RepID=A0A6A6HXG9_9PLEO|nr:NAD(P)-binding protein [Trematosphaeria pertusa]KAF2242422.1 NAD(P)-binding protein [Trematosphaeria pertusa]